MPDRSFEEQVREELADLRMQPGAASWEVVAAFLQRERKRRWVLWLLLLTVCCGGSWLWWELQTAKERQTGIVNEQHKTTHDRQSGRESEAGNELFEKKQGVREIPHRQQGRTDKIITPIPAPEGIRAEVPDAYNATIEKKEMLTATVLPETSSDSLQQKTIARTTDTVIIKEKTRVKDKKKWQVHLLANAGNSGVRNSVLGTSAASADTYYSLPSGNLNNGAMPGAAPPAFHDAFSFNLGVEFNKIIGRKNSLGLSIGYGLYQNNLRVGEQKDSILGSLQNRSYSNAGGYYYRNADSMNYTNKYHFLEVSVHLYTPFRLFHAWLFRWELGMGANILLGSNGLHYDRQSNFLFQNNDLLRKLNWQLSTGLDIGIGKQPFLYIGPQAKFFITNLSRQEGTKQYLLQPSLRAVYVLPQAKH